MRNFEADRGKYFPCPEAVKAGLTWSANREAWVPHELEGAELSLVPDAIFEFCPNDIQLAMVEWYQWDDKIHEFLRKEEKK